MGFLIDTNVLSELPKGPKCNPGVAEWLKAAPAEEFYLSVLVVGELRRGVELLRRKDPRAAHRLAAWLPQLIASYERRILPITEEIAERWAVLSVPDALPVIDGLLAATAMTHDLILITRNTKDVERTGVQILNPFSA
jgi:predicted nucleic acid-binding protein